MLFNSYIFWVFFTIVFLLYRVLNHRYQNRMLLVASYIFYGYWDWRFLSLIFISTVIDYIVANKIVEVADQKHKKRLLLISLIANLGMLGFFKYYGFFVHETGILFNEWTTEGLILAIREFEKKQFNSQDCIEQAQKFSKERFKREIKDFIKSKIK